MSGDDLDDFWMHQVTVETYQGVNASTGAKSYAGAVSVPCFLDGRQKFIRNENGEQVIAAATVFADVSYAATLAPQSRVTVAGQRATFVMQRDTANGSTGFLDGLDHVQAYMQ